MHVSEAMHKEVRSVTPTMPVRDLAKIMKTEDIGAIPVVENDRMIGMITDRDLALRAFADGHDISMLTAREVMSPGATFCHATDRIEEAVHMMEKHKIRRLPVMNAQNRMVGMLSIGDISHCGSKPLTDLLMKSVSEHHA
ncbi:CBS domain-containing protein [Rhizobium leucaenae]|uniref:CBS domain-containing protein n=1 Tax=Rhizobium leucaenae TaxID=29450 RepID=UPI0007EE3BE6|nr:CBS domain-containing protein [Rhizobium leucaenae]